jgi:hypothetical protein
MIWIGLVIGIFVGVPIGVGVMALCFVASNADSGRE